MENGYYFLKEALVLLAALAAILGRKQLNLLTRTIIDSKTFRHFYNVMLVAFAMLGLLYAFLIGTLKVLHGEVIIGITVFSLVALSILFFAFINYKVTR